MKTLFALLLTLVLFTGAFAQPIVTQNTEKSQATNVKIAKLDLCMKILPLALNKSQYQDLFIAIGKARQKWKGQMEKEDAALADVASDISDALDAALNKGVYPSQAFQTKVSTMNQNANLGELLLTNTLVDDIYNVVTKSFNSGQIKVMAGSYAAAFIKPGSKESDYKDVDKVKFYIQAVFMDPWAFDVVSSLSTMVPGGGKTGGG